ncbi:MAG TPA: HAD-IA family hydrolase [Roseiarcus sp.]|nr:HAD-IA family hydrolase [Roseiarcus sp.]
MIRALIFDVDGTLAETEEGHRRAFNAAFAEAGLAWAWDVNLYRELYRVTGGKERMRRYADMRGVSAAEFSDADIAKLHGRKNAHYAELVRAGECPLRPGVERLVRTSRARGLRLAISTTTSRVNIVELVEATLRPNGLALFEVVVSGEDVAAKKPAPDAYLRVLEALALRPDECLAFEDSHNGLLSARAAGLATIVTPSLYTRHETFAGAAVVLPDLTDFDLAASGFASEAASA